MGVVLEDPPHSAAAELSTPAARSNSLSFACVGDELPTASGGDRSGGAAGASASEVPAAVSGAGSAGAQDMHVSQVRRFTG